MEKTKPDCTAAEHDDEEETQAAMYSDGDRCVICGQYVPEGTMVCHQCYIKIMNDPNCNKLLQI